MNKIFFLLVFINATITNAQIITIPDANFKAKLLMADVGQAIAATNWTYDNPNAGYSIKIDTNNDGEIQQSEALEVSYLAITNSSISDLTGIEYFTNLHFLSCAVNSISTINLSTLTQMESLQVLNNQLTNLDLTNLTNLKMILCWNNPITSLDFTGLTSLKKVYCSYNNLSSLDFSGNPELDDLGCEHNPNLSSIKIKNNKMQLYGNQTLYNECWGGNPSLNYICADSFEIAGLQSFLASCGITQPITIDSACELSNDNFAFNTGVSVYPNPSSGVFYIDFKGKLLKNTSITVYNLVGQVVYETNLDNVTNFELNIENMASGTYLVKIADDDQSVLKKIIKQ